MVAGDPTIRSLVAALILGGWLSGMLYVITRRNAARAQPIAEALPPARDAPAAQLTLRDILDEVPNPIWRRDSELNLIYVNPAYAALVGAGPADRVTIEQLEISTNARAFAAQARDGATTTIHPERVETQGHRQMMEVVNLPIGRGEVLGMAVDGTGRHQAANAMARQTRALSEALSRLATAIALFDPGGILAHYNASFARLFRLDAGWLDSRPHFDDLLDAMYERRRLPEARDFGQWKAERRHWLKLEAEPAVEVWRLSTGEMLNVRSEARTDGGMLLIVEDETERIRLFGERASLLAVHQATLDHLQEGVAVFGPDGSIRLFNKRAGEVFLIPLEKVAANPTADMLMDHVEQLLNEPERARNLRMLIMSATSGREERRGRITSTLGYVVDYATVPLPDGNALLTFSSLKLERQAAPAFGT